MLASRARQISSTTDVLKTAWVRMIAYGPSGNPTVVKNSRDAIAITISGTISAAYIDTSNALRSRDPTFRSPIAAAVPSVVAITAFAAAVQTDRMNALRISASCHVVDQ